MLGAALLLAAIAMVLLLRQSLTDNVRTATRVRATEIVDLLTKNPNGPLRVEDVEEEFIQVFDADGRLVRSSENVEGEGPLAQPDPGQSLEVNVPFEEGPFLATARAHGSSTIVAGRTLEVVTESTRVVIEQLFFGLPLLVLIVGAVTWRVIGRALAPVESIRAEVDAISTQQLHRRVPMPEGRDEIARLAETMNEMLMRLEEGSIRQGRFVSDASHELRSPVASIRQHAEVALRHPTKTSPKALAEVVLDENLRLQDLIEDLLLLTRTDETAHSRRMVVLDLDDVVFEEAGRMGQVARRPIDTTRVSAGRVLGDRKQLARLIDNLLDNALRHADSLVVVSLTEEGDDVVLRVDDDGQGVPIPDRTRIFERFVRLQDSRDRDSGGSGLGLAIVAEVAGAHRGSVKVVDSTLGGARFEIVLPRAADPGF